MRIPVGTVFIFTAIAIVAGGASTSALAAEPRFSPRGFRPNAQYVRELRRYGVLPASFDPGHDALDVFRADQDYWRLLAVSARE